jgi:hypothetical protein
MSARRAFVFCRRFFCLCISVSKPHKPHLISHFYLGYHHIFIYAAPSLVILLIRSVLVQRILIRWFPLSFALVELKERPHNIGTEKQQPSIIMPSVKQNKTSTRTTNDSSSDENDASSAASASALVVDNKADIDAETSHASTGLVEEKETTETSSRRQRFVDSYYALICCLVLLAISLIAAAVAAPLLMRRASFKSNPSLFGAKNPIDGNATLTNATAAPTRSPNASSTARYSNTSSTTFYVIGDVPYNAAQAYGLKAQMQNMAADAEFVVHLGDLRNGNYNAPCLLADYTSVAESFRLSHAPVFVMLGDNDWNDCINPNQALGLFRSTFTNFESTYWTTPFTVQRLAGYPETFSFEHKGSLFIGLSLVGGEVLNQTEWSIRLTAQANWFIWLVTQYNTTLAAAAAAAAAATNITNATSPTGRVVLFGHAEPNSKHAAFFNPLRSFIGNDLNNALPILYIHGDGHRWLYNPSYFNLASLLRIMVVGGSSEPPLKLTVDENGTDADPVTAFVYDRRL